MSDKDGSDDNGNGNNDSHNNCGFTLPHPSINSELTLEMILIFQQHVITNALAMHFGAPDADSMRKANDVASYARQMWQKNNLEMILGIEQAQEFLKMKLFSPGQNSSYVAPNLNDIISQKTVKKPELKLIRSDDK